MTAVINTPQNIPIDALPFLYINDLQITRTGNTGLTIGSGRCRDSSNTLDILVPTTLTLDLTVNGANGLDTGSLAASTLYYIFVIAKSNEYVDPTDNNRTLINAGLVSASATAPTLPSGYDSARLIGYIFTDGSSHLVSGYFSGTGNRRTYYYDTIVSVLSGGTATSLTAIDLSSAIPAIDNTPICVEVSFTPNTAADKVSFATAGSSATTIPSISSVVAAKAQTGQLNLISKLATGIPKIQYINSAASGSSSVWVCSYDYFI